MYIIYKIKFQYFNTFIFLQHFYRLLFLEMLAHLVSGFITAHSLEINSSKSNPLVKVFIATFSRYISRNSKVINVVLNKMLNKVLRTRLLKGN